MNARALCAPIAISLAMFGAGCNLVLDIGDLPGLQDAGSRDASSDTTVEVGSDARPPDATADGPPGEDADADGGGEACAEASALCGCANLGTDQHNCGWCGHDCEKGVCQSGHCQPFSLVSVSGAIYALAVNGTDVFFTTSRGALACSVDPSTCNNTARIIASGAASYSGGLAVVGGSVFWSDDANEIVSCPIGGCDGGTATVLAPAQGGMVGGIAADPSRVYWAEWPGTSVLECVSTDCGPTLAPVTPVAQVNPFGVAVQGAGVYWTSLGDSSADGGSVVTCATTGCVSPTVLASGQDKPWAIASDGTTVYWTDGTGAVWSCPAASCSDATARELAAGPGLSEGAVAVYDGGVYWANGSVFYCPATGCGDGGLPTKLGTSGNYVQGIAVDSTGIYWIQGNAPGNVMKLVH